MFECTSIWLAVVCSVFIVHLAPSASATGAAEAKHQKFIVDPTTTHLHQSQLTFFDSHTNETLRSPFVTSLPAHCWLNASAKQQNQLCNYAEISRNHPPSGSHHPPNGSSHHPPSGSHPHHPHPVAADEQQKPPPDGWLAGWSSWRPCSCANLNCGCCAGVSIQRPRFERQYCTNFTYDPNAFSLGMLLTQDDRSIYEYSISGRNPSPLCLPIPYMPIYTDMCVKLFNVFTPGRNLHMCMDWLARVQGQPVLVLHFDCMRMGADGVALVKPFEHGGLPASSTTPRTKVPSRATTTTTQMPVMTTTTTEEAAQEAATVFDTVIEII